MTVHVNIAKAKATLSELVASAEAGEEVVLMRAGKPVARLTSFGEPAAKPKRILGAWMKYGPPPDPNLFMGPDPELEELMDKSIWPDA